MKREPGIAEACVARHASRARAADRVSEAADRLFYQRGIRAVGVEEIVAQAGVTKPSLYRRFGSKDELVVSCLQGRFEAVMASIDAIEACYPDDPRSTLRAIITSIAGELAEPDFRGCPITNAAVEFPEEEHPTRLLALALKQQMRARLLGIVSRLPTDRPAELADSLILLMEGARAIRHTSCYAGPACALVAATDALLTGFLVASSD